MKAGYTPLTRFLGRFRSWWTRVRSKGAYRKGGRLLITVAVMLSVILILSVILRARAAPAALSVCAIRTKGDVHALILKAAGEMIGGDYRDYCTVVYTAEGLVSSVSVDAAAVNALTARLFERLEGELSRFSVTAELPLGDLIFPTLFSGRGPSLKVHSTVYGAVSGEVKSTLTDAGINQTLHTLELEVTVSLTVVCMGEEEALEVVTLLPLAEALIVGDIPGGMIV